MGYKYQPEYQREQLAQGIIPSAISYEYAGSISRKRLEYDGTYKDIPVASVPIDSRGLVHLYGRNDMATNQKLGISWLVFDPNDIIVESYSDWESWTTSPGSEHHFIGDRFNLSKPGTYFLSAMLLMNPDNPTIVDEYHGSLCTVAVAEPFRGSISKKELEYDGARGNIPVT